VLELRKISLTRGDFSLTADFAIERGRRVALIGPSGAGKSTLLSIIAGFDEPLSGSVHWNGSDITHLSPASRPVSTVFQDNNLFPHLTVAQNVGLGRDPSLKLAQADHAAVSKSLERVGLDGYGSRKPSDLSGGQQSRVALARVLIRNLPLLLLDEPFSALGPALKSEMLDLVSETAAEMGSTVLLVTHDPSDAQRFADDTALITDGRVRAPQPTEALFSDPPPALRAYIGF
jgi:thiamine transport system ATP-binding protein